MDAWALVKFLDPSIDSFLMPSKTKTTVVLKTTKPRSRAPQKMVVAVSKKPPPGRVHRPLRNTAAASGLSAAYMKCLSDPFTNPPVRAGFGTLVPTSIHTAYLRGSFSTASDGSFSGFVVPNPNVLLNLNLSTFAVAPTGSNGAGYAAGNVLLLNSMGNSARTLAMGIRLIPMIPATSIPGIISLGCAPRCALNDVVAEVSTLPVATPAGLFNQPTSVVSQMPYTREHMARPGGLDFFQLTWRPTDVKDFQFEERDSPSFSYQTNAAYCPFYAYDGNISEVDRVGDTQGSYLVFTGQSMPASTSIFYEIILHMETTNSTDAISTVETTAVTPSIAQNTSHSSFESLYRAIQPYLPTVDSVVAAAKSLMSSTSLHAAATKYAKRSLLGVRTSGYELVQR